MAVYDAWAPYYDIVQTGLPGEAEFYVGQAVRAQGDVLELGCGTGRICIPMAMSGVNVVGLDNADAMLAVCRQKLGLIGSTKGRLQLVKGDMRDFEFGREFAMIAIPYRAFMHLTTVDDQRECLEHVRCHLDEKAPLILNVWAARPSAVAPHLGAMGGVLRLGGAYDLPDGEGKLVHYCASSYDEHRQLLHEEHLLQETNDDGEVLRMERIPMTRAWMTPREMLNLMHGAGFTPSAVFGDFACTPFGPGSTEFIGVFHKR